MIMTQCDKYNGTYRTEERVIAGGGGLREVDREAFREGIEGRIGALQTSNSNFKITAFN